MSRHLFLGVGTPLVRLPWLPSMVPPMAGTTCAYISLSTPVVRLSRLPGKLGGQLFVRGIAGVSVGTLLILQR
jgi:hypothetical protein